MKQLYEDFETSVGNLTEWKLRKVSRKIIIEEPRVLNPIQFLKSRAVVDFLWSEIFACEVISEARIYIFSTERSNRTVEIREAGRNLR